MPAPRKLLRVGSEGRRALGGDGEGALEGDAGAAEGAFFEEAADERDAVRHPALGVELRQRVLGIGRASCRERVYGPV